MLPLPDHWSATETHTDVVTIAGVDVRRAGLASVGPGGEATGSAAELFVDPTPRARFELLERIGILEAQGLKSAEHLLFDEAGAVRGTIAGDAVFLESDAPGTWRHARSNGVAIHTSWEAACLHAKAELVERDRVLRSWAGSTRPVPIPFESSHVRVGEGDVYQWSAFELPAEPGTFGEEFAVVCVVGIPIDAALPVALGYSAKLRRTDALASALREATQMLAFMWGESFATSLPEVAPTAVFHLEALQVPARRELLQRWLAGAHVVYRMPRARTTTHAVRYVDLTPSWMVSHCRIARAICAEAKPLVFGRDPSFGNLPAELQIHPIA